MAQYGVLALGMCAVLLAGCGGTTPPPVQQPPNTAAQVDGARISGAAQDTANWLTHGGTYAEERYSGLAQIDTNTVKTLGLAWSLDLDTNRGQEATPLIIDGVMYTTSAWSKVQAIDAASGKLLWQYDPFVPGKTGVRACCDVVNRGVAAWKGRLYVGTLDGRLVALDAASGKPVWEVVTVDQTKPYTVTGAPRIVKGHVLIGNGGAEFGVRGYISAYDADSGKMLWRFYTVPGDPSQPFEAPILEKAASTWTGEWWKGGGGGTVWDSMAYDPELDLLYVGTGNGSPWSQAHRSPKGGDNLFLSSIVALKPDTGEYVWHYQTTPEDSWDYTATQHIILADLTIDGAPRKVLMQAPKNGFFYVLDRQTGQLLSAKPFITLNWAGGVDMATGRPQVNPEAYYFKTGKPWTALPGPYGAHNWQPMSFSKKTGLVYIPVIESLFTYLNDPNPNWQPSPIGYNLGLIALEMPQDPAIKAQVLGATKGSLKAWDPVAQKEVWSVPLSGMWNGGVLSTAGGLVFQGSGDGSFNAYDASSGAKLWSFAAQAGVLASPVTFSLDNQQYVTVLVGWGGAAIAGGETLDKGALQGNKSRVLTFKLGGSAQLPAAAPAPVPQTAPPARGSDPKIAAAGSALFGAKCSVCHGNAAVSAGKVIPDLRFSKALGDAASWKKIVIDGALENNGMVSFASIMKPEDAEAIRAYVISRANDTFPGQPK
ncbi:MAG TPA: PQQ-dependent dehydrogenase, methanol/ethanol family [Polyangiales bacterium]|nr:PQQ-dependent dehydrogenase, methanol/ethanol family [Polyangiales bacterium]